MKIPNLTETERQALAATLTELAAQAADPTHAAELTEWGKALVSASTDPAPTVTAHLAAMGYTGPRPAPTAG